MGFVRLCRMESPGLLFSWLCALIAGIWKNLQQFISQVGPERPKTLVQFFICLKLQSFFSSLLRLSHPHPVPPAAPPLLLTYLSQFQSIILEDNLQQLSNWRRKTWVSSFHMWQADPVSRSQDEGFIEQGRLVLNTDKPKDWCTGSGLICWLTSGSFFGSESLKTLTTEFTGADSFPQNATSQI